MRLGAPIFQQCPDPESWAQAVRAKGYSAAFCPVDHTSDQDTVRAYAAAAERADIVIAEVGAWSNPLSSDETTRRTALEHCKRQLDLADHIGARCCVNIAGSRGDKWDGPDPRDLTEETFEAIVQSVREIIDAVRPQRTYYTLETMPWMYPDSPESYARLIAAIDRERFGVHLDPANLVCSPQRFFDTTGLLQSCFELLGPHIRSCHAKDVVLSDRFMVHLDQVRPGLGGLDYAAYLEGLRHLDPDTPLLLEHLQSEEEYDLGADYIRGVARARGIEIR